MRKAHPFTQPPWGEMIAVNGNTGEIAWRRPLGSAEIYGDVGAHTGMTNLGGSLATAGGLVFIGSTGLGYINAKVDQPVFRAFDSRTGAELWTVRMSAAAESAPMSFIAKNGRQYVVTAIGGSSRPEGEVALVAFALPRPGDQAVDLKPAPVMQSVLPAAASNMTQRVEDLPAGPGREDLAKFCTGCHAISAVTAHSRSSAEWTATIEQMRARGAVVGDTAASSIHDYLSAHFGTP